jgi:hypothetical protein
MYATWISTDYNIDIGQKVMRFFVSGKQPKKKEEKKFKRWTGLVMGLPCGR